MAKAKKSKNIWPTDGENFDVSDDVFVNRVIEDFISSDSKCFVISPKGMGKTLLLKKKRDRIEKKNSGEILLPKNTIADYVSFPASISNNWLTILEKFETWKIIWEFAIYVSILSQDEFKSEISGADRSNITSKLKGGLGDFVSGCLEKDVKHIVYPSEVVNSVITSNFSDFHQLANYSQNFLSTASTRAVHSSVYVFIDSVDNSLRTMLGHGVESFNPGIWCAGQLGLMHAGWNIGRRNQHIKVCASIRQEAYARAFSEDRQAISGMCSEIRYSRNDIAAMMDLLVQNYEHFDSLTTFIGMKDIENKGVHEDVHSYVRRHTLGKPRGLALIGSRLRDQYSPYRDTSDAQSEFKHIVNAVTATEIVKIFSTGK